ncbi:hypothetical protein Tco_1294737 [Tanacetum coccineum]
MCPSYDPDKKMCDGRVEICGVSKTGNLQFWIQQLRGNYRGWLDSKSCGNPLLYLQAVTEGTMAGVDVDTLTMKQYLALSRENQAPGMVKPEIGGNVNFEIKSQFMRELREDTFFENKDEDAHDHIDRAFIQRYCPPFMTAKQLEDIHNFKQEGDESLYQAWERYNDLLYKCPTHDINNHQKVNIFYKGLSTMNRQLLDSLGTLSPGMRLSEALTAIQDHGVILLYNGRREQQARK